jgi:hypothetical protein
VLGGKGAKSIVGKKIVSGFCVRKRVSCHLVLRFLMFFTYDLKENLIVQQKLCEATLPLEGQVVWWDSLLRF